MPVRQAHGLVAVAARDGRQLAVTAAGDVTAVLEERRRCSDLAAGRNVLVDLEGEERWVGGCDKKKGRKKRKKKKTEETNSAN